MELDHDIHERHRGHQDQHRHDPGLEVLQIAHLQPFRQPVLGLVPLASDHEQAIEAERGDHQRHADQEQVLDDQEMTQLAANPSRIADVAGNRGEEDDSAVHEGAGRDEQQHDHGQQDEQPG